MRRCSGVICDFGFVTNRRAGIFSDTGCAKWTKTNGYAARRTWLTTSGLIADAGFFSPKDSIAADPSPRWTDISRDKDFNSFAFYKYDKVRLNKRNSVTIQDHNLKSWDTIWSFRFLIFILHFFPFRRSRHLEILESKDTNDRRIEVTRIRDRKISRVSRCFFCCRNERPRVRPWTNVHLSERDLQFNATASSRNASALSDEEGTTPTAQKKRLPLPCTTLPSPCLSLPPPCSLLNIIR